MTPYRERLNAGVYAGEQPAASWTDMTLAELRTHAKGNELVSSNQSKDELISALEKAGADPTRAWPK